MESFPQEICFLSLVVRLLPRDLGYLGERLKTIKENAAVGELRLAF